MRGRSFLATPWSFSFAPRALSSRSLRPSRPQLRPAFACDRAGTARRADPRCSPPSHETLGRGQRFHPPVWPLGSHTHRRHGSSRPRGGFHRHTPDCNDPAGSAITRCARCLACGFLRVGDLSTASLVRWRHNRRSARAPGARAGRGWRQAKGPGPASACPVEREGVSGRRARGRARPESREHEGQKRNRSRERRGVRTATAGKEETPGSPGVIVLPYRSRGVSRRDPSLRSG
jgi:hypothetical protein